MASNTKPQRPFTCIICLETQTTKHLNIDASPVCHACFRQLFIRAIESESEYPAHWGDKPLRTAPYAHILGAELHQQYKAKTTEYDCPPRERVYCQRKDSQEDTEVCGHFVGRWQPGEGSTECPECKALSCLRCGDVLRNEGPSHSDAARHCEVRRVEDFEDRAFNGLKRGRDYQICPNEGCKRKIELAYGCNHIKCRCRTNFCFICGKLVAKRGDGHSTVGGCPRFGQPDSARAIYDDEQQFLEPVPWLGAMWGEHQGHVDIDNQQFWEPFADMDGAFDPEAGWNALQADSAEQHGNNLRAMAEQDAQDWADNHRRQARARMVRRRQVLGLDVPDDEVQRDARWTQRRVDRDRDDFRAPLFMPGFPMPLLPLDPDRIQRRPAVNRRARAERRRARSQSPPAVLRGEINFPRVEHTDRFIRGFFHDMDRHMPG